MFMNTKVTPAVAPPKADEALRAYYQAETDWHTIEDQYEAKQISHEAYTERLEANKLKRFAADQLVLTSHAGHLRDVDAKLHLLATWLDEGEWPDRKPQLLICSIRRDLCALQVES